MSEVEKMYENANVEKQIPKICSSNKLYCKECEAHIEDAMPYCQNAEYPPFTPEKQLKLIKWLARFDVRIEYTNAKYFIESHYHGYSEYMKYFEQALAGFINILWQDLTEQERTEIAEILRG